jgi:endogenous inhibitor of DNA gyrase (YacG/DUF329 family)
VSKGIRFRFLPPPERAKECIIARAEERAKRTGTTFARAVCETCGEAFLYPASQHGRRFCSRACFGQANGQRTGTKRGPRVERVTVSCNACGKKITRTPSGINPTNFCGRDCYNRYRKEEYARLRGGTADGPDAGSHSAEHRPGDTDGGGARLEGP